MKPPAPPPQLMWTPSGCTEPTARSAPAVDRQADEVELEQLAELAAEFEPRLVPSVVGRRRPPDRRQELAAAHDLVAYGRHVVLPAAAAEEAQVLLARLVARELLAQ